MLKSSWAWEEFQVFLLPKNQLLKLVRANKVVLQPPSAVHRISVSSAELLISQTVH